MTRSMKRRWAGSAPAALLFVLAQAATAAATDYYVATAGSDAADGLTPGSAWATLQFAADTVLPGDTVHVADGNYAGFNIAAVGSAAQPIVFLAEGSAVAITSDNASTPDGINIENAAYITIDGFISSGRTRAGIRSAVSNHITVRNCTAGTNGRWGIFTGFVDDLLIEDNETFGSIAEHGIYTSNSGDRPVIRRNHVHDNHANGIHMNGDQSMGGDGLISNALVESNVIHGNGAAGGSGINMDGVTDSVVRNNLLYDNHASGISLYQIDGATGSTGNLVINNTIVNASNARWCVNINTGSTGNRLYNNILYNNHPSRGVITIDSSSLGGFASDYNSLMDRMSSDGDATIVTLATWQSLGYDTHSFTATPADHFLNPAGDFHLLGSSPAIDAGTAIDAPGTDVEGGARPVGGGFDIGAYEAQLPNCNDGNIDAGEICGEPGLPVCADPCTTCLGCICAGADPVCGDALVCGGEQCESDGDCAGALVCSGCQCVNPPLCTSGIALARAKMKMRANVFSLAFSGEAVIPKPWTAVNPAANGVHVVIDAVSGPGGLDAVIPGGALWRTNGSGTAWTYVDAAGAVAGITKVVVKDRSKSEDGKLRFVVKGKGGAAALPDVAAVRTSIGAGAAGECAALQWGGPGAPRPSCSGDAAMLRCR
ncbi:MAG: right-handed parallel beta-helix repeat-containing protein [Deltaproteobacteria bacterium]|nr:right-handed parallel beta-helix repeat-containing protein [Deltaproteobacteria bacterium]